MTDTPEIVAGELVSYEPAAPSTLFGTSDPELALERMAAIAKPLDHVLRDRGLVKRISGNDYILAGGWTVLGGMVGVAPYTAWIKPLDDGTGWIARVEIRRVADGTTIAAAEQVCTRSEGKWARAEDHALAGMAQTRAMARALRGALMQIVELAGYRSTPAEEMPTDAEIVEPAKPDPDPASKIPPDRRPTGEQGDRLRAVLHDLEELDPEDRDWQAIALDIAGIPGWHLATATIVAGTLEQLEAIRGRLADAEEAA